MPLQAETPQIKAHKAENAKKPEGSVDIKFQNCELLQQPTCNF